MTLQLTDCGSVLLYALYIAERLLLCFECEILVYIVRQTTSYIKIQYSVHWRAEVFVIFSSVLYVVSLPVAKPTVAQFKIGL